MRRSNYLTSKLKHRAQLGQALTEYVLLLVLAAGVSITFFTVFNGFLQNGFTRFNAVLESEIRVGGFPENRVMWEN